MLVQEAAFATDVPPDIYAFHRYTTHSASVTRTQAPQYRWHVRGWATGFHRRLREPPAHPLDLINPDNARILRITAAAGTELADAYSNGTLNALCIGRIAPI